MKLTKYNKDLIKKRIKENLRNQRVEDRLMKKRFIYFKKRGMKSDKRNLIKFRCDGCEKQCLKSAPIEVDRLTGRVNEFSKFKKFLIEKCREKLK